jgi:hypothetical protein
MAIQRECFIFTLLVTFDIAVAAVISCTNPSPVAILAGGEGTSSTVCVMPEGCEKFSTTLPGTEYPLPSGEPLVRRMEHSIGPGLLNYTLQNTFRGFENMLGEGQYAIRSFEWEFRCTPKGLNSESTVVNFTVELFGSADHAAVVPPAEIAIPCLVQSVETPVVVDFGTPNASLTYRSLVAGWTKTDFNMPWVYSRPSQARSMTPTSAHWYDSRSQPILQSIAAGPNGSSLVLNIKPPESWFYDVSWQICIIPGDGYNWFPEICTQYFPVRKSQEECDGTTTTTTTPSSSASTLHSFGTWRLALVVMMPALFHFTS